MSLYSKKYKINANNGRLAVYSRSKGRRKARKSNKRASHHSKRMKMKIPLLTLQRSTSNDAPYYSSFQIKKEKDIKYSKEISSNDYEQTENSNSDAKFSGIQFGKLATLNLTDYNFVAKNIYVYYDLMKQSYQFEWLLIAKPDNTSWQQSCANRDINEVTKYIQKHNDHHIFSTLNKQDNSYIMVIRKMKELSLKCANNKSQLACIPTIYYSGHGAEKTGDWEFESNQIRLMDILRIFIKNKCLMLIVDCCFAGAFVRDIEQKKDIVLNELINEYKNLIIFSSSDYYECSYWEDSFTHWAFCNGCMPSHTASLYVNGKKQDISNVFDWNFHE